MPLTVHKLKPVEKPMAAGRPIKPLQPRSALAMIRATGKRENLLAALVGAAMGGFVPCATFAIAHFELSDRFWTDPKSCLVAGGLVYSARTVIQWGKRIMGDWTKAIGFCVLLEGVMVFSNQTALSHFALAMLIAINGVGFAVSLLNQDR